MSDHHPELPPTPPTPAAGPVIDPSSTAEPEVPRPMAPERPSTTSSPWTPQFEMPPAAPAGPFPHPGAASAAGPGSVSTAPARTRRRASRPRRLLPLNRTRAIVAGSSAAAFVAILTGVALADHTEPGSSVNRTSADDQSPSSSGSSSSSVDPGLVRPYLGGGDSTGSGATSPFPRGLSGGFSAVPGPGSASPNTRSHGS